MIWAALSVMCLFAVGFAIRPLLRDLPAKNVLAVLSIVLVCGLAAGLYHFKGSPDVPSGAAATPDVEQMLASLATRLESQPDDLNGWIMLGRSYMAMQNFQGAIAAYEKAVSLESAQNAQTLVALGIALVEGNGKQISPRAKSVFENALAIEPNHPEGLFWGGIGAFNDGNNELAAERWEALLATDPPEQIATVLRERIASWRGEPVPAVSTAAAPAAAAGTAQVVTASIDLSEDARANLPAEAAVFIIARDPGQPSPPIAVTRRSLSELPLSVSLGDREAMIPGRNLSAFAEFEIVARVSVSGTPAAQPGDWFAAAIVRPAESDTIELSIGERVQ